MTAYLLVFLGAGVGGAIRHGMNMGVGNLLGTHFPWHTFAINIVGSLVMGLVAGWFTYRADPTGHVRLFLTTGILGGYTTFSAFSLDAALGDAEAGGPGYERTLSRWSLRHTVTAQALGSSAAPDADHAAAATSSSQRRAARCSQWSTRAESTSVAWRWKVDSVKIGRAHV